MFTNLAFLEKLGDLKRVNMAPSPPKCGLQNLIKLGKGEI
jgi:hypothetical protein